MANADAAAQINGKSSAAKRSCKADNCCLEVAAVYPELGSAFKSGFEEGDLHLLNLCEVGGHKQGLPACCIEADSVVDGALTKNESGTHAVQAYMSIWHETRGQRNEEHR